MTELHGPTRPNRIQRPARQPMIPAHEGHKVICVHRWCYCYNLSGHEGDPTCTICRTKRFNDQAVKQADPTIRHPEGDVSDV